MKKIILILLTVIFALTLFSCGSGDEPTDVTTSDLPVETTAPEEKPDDLMIAVGGKTEYSLIRPEFASDEIKAAAIELYKAIDGAAGCSIPLKEDFLMRGTQPGEYEILLGSTNREETELARSEIRYNDFIIKQYGKKLVILGGNDEALIAAINYFTENFLGEEIIIPGGTEYISTSDYSMDEVTLDGVAIGQYTLVYSGVGGREAATAFADRIGRSCGAVLRIVPQSEPVSEREIVFGSTNRNRDITCAYYGYKVTRSGSSLFVNGHDDYDVNYAGYITALALLEGVFDLSALEKVYNLPDRNEYINDIDKLWMRWAPEFEPDQSMLDWEGKISALTKVSSRLLTEAHRADHGYYPENSIESIISVYKMGGDIVEIDFHETRDGVLVLMHDDKLTRMTNYSEMAGKTVGDITLPTSEFIKDWSLEELRCLKLKENQGGSNAGTSEFRIATLEEALIVCKKRLFIVPDKVSEWRYADIDGVFASGHKNNFLFDYMKKTGNYNSILISYDVNLKIDEAVTLQKYIYERSGGVMPYIFLRNHNGYYELKNKAIGGIAIQVNGQFNPDSYPTSLKSVYANLKDKVVLGGWTINDTTDNIDVWRQMYDLGYRIIMSNDIIDLVRLAQTTVK